jgi:hypothetical protein
MFTRSSKSEAIERYVTGMPTGTTLRPSDVLSLIGERADNSKYRGWQIVAGVIPRLERDHGIVLRWERGESCWTVLTDAEKAVDLSKRTRRIYRAAKRNERVMDCIDFANLDEEQKKSAVVSCMVSSAVRIVTSGRSQKMLSVFAEDKPVIPDETTLLRLFVRH